MKIFFAASTSLFLAMSAANAATGDYICKSYGGTGVTTDNTTAQVQAFLNASCDKTKQIVLTESALRDDNGWFNETACCLQK